MTGARTAARATAALAALCAALLATGCGSSREIRDVSFVLGVGVERAEGGDYHLTFEVANPVALGSEGTPITDSPVRWMTAGGPTIDQAVEDLNGRLAYRLSWAQLQAIIVAEPLAREGLLDVLDYFTRHREMRDSVRLFVSRTAPAEIFHRLPALNPVPSVALAARADVMERRGLLPPSDLRRIVAAVSGRGQQAIVSSIAPAPGGELAFPEIGFLRGDRLVGWAAGPAADGARWFLGRITRQTFDLPCAAAGPEAARRGVSPWRYSLTIGRSRTAIRVWRSGAGSGGSPRDWRAQVSAHADLAVTGDSCRTLLTPEHFPRLERAAADRIEAAIQAGLRAAREAGSDPFGFGAAIRRQDPAAWREMEERWDTTWWELPVAVKAEARVRRTGVTLAPIELVPEPGS